MTDNKLTWTAALFADFERKPVFTFISLLFFTVMFLSLFNYVIYIFIFMILVNTLSVVVNYFGDKVYKKDTVVFLLKLACVSAFSYYFLIPIHKKFITLLGQL